LRVWGSAAELVLEGLALEFLGEMVRRAHRAPTESRPASLRQAREAIHARFAGPIGLGRLAEAVGDDQTGLDLSFRLAYGCSVGDYVRRCRLEHAAEQLTLSDTPLAAIAIACGFYDQSHFTNAFRAHMKLTPAQYRAIRRGRPVLPTRAPLLQD
jgi:transcriptional regulator GlxA family with amidase domain